MKRLAKVRRHVRLPANTRGRDFVVGDLHGHRALLEWQLDREGFDAACDRVLCVGDLIDRGPESMATLSMLDEPWFHAVLGNHELMLLNYLRRYDSRVHSRKAFAAGSGDWIVHALDRHRKTVYRLADAVAGLPLVLHIDGDLPFNVMHSDLHPIGVRQEALLGGGSVCVHLADVATASRVNSALTSRETMTELPFADRPVRLSRSPLGELPITYVGHSRMRHVTVHRSYVYIDQGVRATSSKTTTPVPPTVLDHQRFGYWLLGVARAQARDESPFSDGPHRSPGVSPASADRRSSRYE